MLFQSKNASASTSIPTKGPINQTKEGHFSITIQVKPGAKVNSITGKDTICCMVAIRLIV